MPSRTTPDDSARRRFKEHDRGSTSSREKSRSSRKKSSSRVHLTDPRRSTSREHDRERERDKDRDRDRDRARDKDKARDRDRDSPRPLSGSERASRNKIPTSLPEMERRVSSNDMRPHTSYPSFSKAHSRETVGSREDISNQKDPSIPSEPVDASNARQKRRSSVPSDAHTSLPSAPLTPDSTHARRPDSAASMRKKTNDSKRDLNGESKSTDSTPKANGTKKYASNSSLRKDINFRQSEVSSMPGAFPEELDRRSTPTSGYRRTVSTGSHRTSTVTDDTLDSDRTSVADDRRTGKRPPNIEVVQEASPPSPTDSQPKTPTPQDPVFPPSSKPHIIDVERSKSYQYPSQYHGGDGLDPVTPKTSTFAPPLPPAPPPPPPPPPPAVNTGNNVPRVDYLLKNGGLGSLVPRRLVQNGPPGPVQQYSTYNSPSLAQMATTEEYAKVFSGLHSRLDDYLHVLRHNGSLAVATGYRSVARRLLDKLSQIFARDISSQRCDCVMCMNTSQPTLSDEEDSGVSWGEILEFVSGRRELPQWPPFTIQPDESGLGISSTTEAPMQKLDIDVPEEYKEHYVRQNQKTKKAVQSWLAQQPEHSSSPPEDADEDTLMFAMMTRLEVQQRNFFIALMHGHTTISQSRAPTPAERPETASGALRRAKGALQRLYRLGRTPRDCESAMYLLKNPHLHGMIATLAEVNEQEWDILVSGRFDGFLWSGAEAPQPPSASQYNQSQSRVPSRGAAGTPLSRNNTPFSPAGGMPHSRSTTPYSPLRNAFSPEGNHSRNGYRQQHPAAAMFPSRGPTPGLGVAPPAPVQLDEDTEIAVLAEVERNLFSDMERFEDAFEVLHSRVELVRQMLRERSAGLSMQSQLRRGSSASDIGVRLDTPASGVTNFAEDEETDDDGLADLASLAPDDSASQISTNRKSRPRRERRTPAPIGEEDESVFEEEVRKVTHGGRRSKY